MKYGPDLAMAIVAKVEWQQQSTLRIAIFRLPEAEKLGLPV